MILVELFLTFLKIGIFTFGGGYAMVALIQNELVVKHGWLTAQEFTDILAVSQMTPGPVGINTATYAGYTAVMDLGYPAWMAVAGALLASFAVILLPVLLMLVVYGFLNRHKDNAAVASMFRIMRLAVVGLIAAASLLLLTRESFGSPGLNKQFIVSVLLFFGVFWCSCRHRTNPILLIAISGLAGLIIYSF